MNSRAIITVLLLIVVVTLAAVYARGCAPVAVSPRYDCSFLTEPDLTPAEKKIAWQKMKKWRSVHNAWFEDDPTPQESSTSTKAEEMSASARGRPRSEAADDENRPAE